MIDNNFYFDFLITKFNNEEEVVNYLFLISQNSVNLKKRIIISCNDGIEINSSLLPKNIQVFQYISENIGYFRGVFNAYRLFTNENNSPSKYFIISNTDISFASSTFFNDLLNFKLFDDKTIVVGPAIFNSIKKTYDNPKYTKRIPKHKILLTLFIHRFTFLSKIYLRIGNFLAKKKKANLVKSSYVYALQGCFLIFKEEFLRLYNSNPYSAFLFSEENYVAELARVNNKLSWYDSRLIIYHHEKQSTNKVNNNQISKYYFDSLRFIYENFYK